MLQLNHDLACHVFMGLFSERKYLRAHNKTGQTSSQGKKKKLILGKSSRPKCHLPWDTNPLLSSSKVK